MILIGYAGFLRFSELVNIKRPDLKFFESYLSISITKSKTDLYREGSDVVIVKLNSFSYPVVFLDRIYFF